MVSPSTYTSAIAVSPGLTTNPFLIRSDMVSIISSEVMVRGQPGGEGIFQGVSSLWFELTVGIRRLAFQGSS
jgi:hypothetical protein